MQHHEGNFEGFDQTKLYYQAWKNEIEDKGTVIISHGFGEHSGRHSNLAVQLVTAGFSVYALDHRGHGNSGGKQNYVKRFTDYLSDLELFTKLVREKEPTGSYHLYGHSMGSIIANNYLGLYQDQKYFRSSVLTGTGSAPGPAIGKGVQVVSKIIGKILPSLSVASGLDPEFISHDPDVVKAYIDDPLVHYKKITARLASELLAYTKNMNKAAQNVKVPTMIAVGSEDEAFHPKSWPILLENLGTDDKELKVYENMRHEICNEVEKEKPIQDIVSWILTHNSS
ncbi:MAG: alpha/beta hydrolase [Candidatus Zixiibacteriota bacterium]